MQLLPTKKYYTLVGFKILVALILFSNQLIAQEEVHPDSLQLAIKPYGSFRGHFAIYNNEMEFQENASRIGFQLGVKKRNIHFFAGIELGMNLFKSNSRFNADGNSSGGFLVLENDQISQVFTTRLGFLGLDFGEWGKLSFGKQWSVYYDVTSYTDRFNVFGGRGSATYVAGTDGGGIGTGRADQSVIYRNTFGRFKVGAQLQAKSANNNEFIDGIGFSLQYNILDNLKIGTAYNTGRVNENLMEDNTIIGLDNDPSYYSIGFKYDSKNFEFSGVYVNQTNGDLTESIIANPDLEDLRVSIAYDAIGFEVYSKYKFDKFNIVAGYNYYNPDFSIPEDIENLRPLHKDFGVRQLILGLEYKPSKLAYFYAEGRIDSGTSALGESLNEVLTIGLRIEVDRLYNSVLHI